MAARGIDLSVSGLEKAVATLAAIPKEHKLATYRAQGEVAGKARTLAIKRSAKALKVTAKTIRTRFRIYRKPLNEQRTKVWGGTAASLRSKDIGRTIPAPDGAATFHARMASGHEGEFFKSVPRYTRTPRRFRVKGYGNIRTNPENHDLPISEASIDLAPVLTEEIPRAVVEVFDREYVGRYWKDLRKRIDKRQRRTRR